MLCCTVLTTNWTFRLYIDALHFMWATCISSLGAGDRPGRDGDRYLMVSDISCSCLSQPRHLVEEHAAMSFALAGSAFLCQVCSHLVHVNFWQCSALADVIVLLSDDSQTWFKGSVHLLSAYMTDVFSHRLIIHSPVALVTYVAHETRDVVVSV